MKEYKKKNYKYFIGALMCALAGTVFAIVLQFFKGAVLDNAVAGRMQETIRYSLLLIGFIMSEVLAFFWYEQFSAKFVVGCIRHLKHDIFESIMRRSYVEYKEHPQGEYIAKYVNEADSIKERYFLMLPLFWEILFKILFVSTALFFLDWRLALITIGLLTTPLYIPKILEKRLQSAQEDYLKAVEETLAKINDWFTGFEIIKNYSIEHKIMEKFEKVNDFTMEKYFRDRKLGVAAQLITTLISYLSYFIVLVCAAWLVLKGKFSAGDFFIAIGMIDQLSYPLISLAAIIRQLVSVKPTCVLMEKFIKNAGETDEKSELETLNSEIRFQNVTFAYQQQELIIHDFNFTIQKGKRYLLKGPSGCGKTTIVNLLLRYYKVSSGEILMDGRPMETVGNTYKCMTVVRQEAVLFHDTLRNNLTMYQELTDSCLMEVLNMLGLEKFANVSALDQMIDENGTNLSGGEKKRVCLARALLRDTDILILDEPLANLDEQNVEKIENLLLKIEGKTMLVVSHEFSEEKLGSFHQVLDFGAVVSG